MKKDTVKSSLALLIRSDFISSHFYYMLLKIVLPFGVQFNNTYVQFS